MNTNPLRCAVIGSGAVGTLLAVTLTRTGNDVVLLGRTARGGAPERRRVRFDAMPGGRTLQIDLPVDHRSGPIEAEIVILCVPCHALNDVISLHAGLLGQAQAVVSVQGGIPWWYFSGTRGVYSGRAIVALDPQGVIARTIPADKIIGGVLEGTVIRGDGNGNARVGLVLGEIDGTVKPRTERIAAAFTAGRIQAVVTPHIRTAMWRTLLADVAIQPLSALTRSTPKELYDNEIVRGKLAETMREAITIAAALDIILGTTAEAELQRRGTSTHIPPMLRDVLAGQPLEIEALTGALVEIGQMTKMPIPVLLELDAMVRLLAHSSAGRTEAAPQHATRDRFSLPA